MTSRTLGSARLDVSEVCLGCLSYGELHPDVVKSGNARHVGASAMWA